MRKNDIEWYHDAEEINRALRILREECTDHINCRSCPLALVNGRCALGEYSPDSYEEVYEND